MAGATEFYCSPLAELKESCAVSSAVSTGDLQAVQVKTAPGQLAGEGASESNGAQALLTCRHVKCPVQASPTYARFASQHNSLQAQSVAAADARQDVSSLQLKSLECAVLQADAVWPMQDLSCADLDRSEVVSPQLRSALIALDETLRLLSTQLDAVVFRETWKAIAVAINRELYNEVATEAKFSFQASPI